MDCENLITCLEKHLKWLNDEDGGERAKLRGVNLNGADLSGTYLRGADLRGAILSGADLRGADLRGAILSGADLRGAILSGADLRVADLRGVDLRGVDLCRANLIRVDLRDANLPSELIATFFPLACPEFGEFIGWKKALVFGNANQKQVIIKLRVPEDARRSSAFGRKCRCDKAVVIAIENMDGGRAKVNEAFSTYDPTFFYRVGETVSVDNFDTDRTNECASGIHFFITRQEAVDY